MIKINLSNSVLSLDDKTLELLKEKHPKSCELNEEIIWSEEKPIVHSVIFGDTNEDMIKIETMKTNRASDTTKLDADGWGKASTEEQWY